MNTVCSKYIFLKREEESNKVTLKVKRLDVREKGPIIVQGRVWLPIPPNPPTGTSRKIREHRRRGGYLLASTLCFWGCYLP